MRLLTRGVQGRLPSSLLLAQDSVPRSRAQPVPVTLGREVGRVASLPPGTAVADNMSKVGVLRAPCQDWRADPYDPDYRSHRLPSALAPLASLCLGLPGIVEDKSRYGKRA